MYPTLLCHLGKMYPTLLCYLGNMHPTLLCYLGNMYLTLLFHLGNIHPTLLCYLGMTYCPSGDTSTRHTRQCGSRPAQGSPSRAGGWTLYRAPRSGCTCTHWSSPHPQITCILVWFVKTVFWGKCYIWSNQPKYFDRFSGSLREYSRRVSESDILHML